MTLAAACDSMLTKPSLYNSVPVIVSRRNGQGIPGAALVLYTGQRPMGYATTDSGGRFTFALVPQGVYGILATPPDGYDLIERVVGGPRTDVVAQLYVQDDTLSPVRFTFLKRGPGALTVRATDAATGASLPGAKLTLYDPKSTRGAVTTDATGRASFSNVPFGVYGVILERPLFYRDYRAPGDSLYSARDNLIVDDGSRDSVSFVLRKCAGTLRVFAQDEFGLPVPGAPVLFYTASQQLGVRPTGADGRVSNDMPCALQTGVNIGAPAGYSVSSGRGLSFIDGMTFTNGQTLDVTFRLRRGAR